MNKQEILEEIALWHLDQIGTEEREEAHENLERIIMHLKNEKLSKAFREYERALNAEEIKIYAEVYMGGLLDGIRLVFDSIKERK